MRTASEVVFRIRQEIANAALCLRPPVLPEALSDSLVSPLSGLPDPGLLGDQARGSDYGRQLLQLAERITEGRMPLLGIECWLKTPVAWRRDFLSGRETPPVYFRRIPYLHYSVAGDHKAIWELNRHQYLVTLAQAACIEARPVFIEVIENHLISWEMENPFQRGINWASALEVAFRALSWIWIFHLVGDRLSRRTRRLLLNGLYQHGRHLEENLSIYFSPNTHLLGEAVALHALGALFPSFPHAKKWRKLGDRIVHEQVRTQVRADGGHFEQSTYYHMYALDMFVFHAVVSGGRDELLKDAIHRMADYLDALVDDRGRLPFIGDDDGGRFFSPDGDHERYGLATLASADSLLNAGKWRRSSTDLWPCAAWWMGASVFDQPQSPPRDRTSRLFAETGVAVMRAGDITAIVDAGPFGPGSAGHSHSDTLSIVISAGPERILIDPGTFTYVSDPAARDAMRGSAAHNTIRIGERDQANPAGPFRWSGKPDVLIAAWKSNDARDFLDASCRYRGFTHRRRVLFLKPGRFFIVDEVSGPSGANLVVEQFWHAGEQTIMETDRSFRIGKNARLTVSDRAFTETGGEAGWISPALGRRQPAPVVRVRRETGVPAVFLAAIELGASGAAGELYFDEAEGSVCYGPERFPLL